MCTTISSLSGNINSSRIETKHSLTCFRLGSVPFCTESRIQYKSISVCFFTIDPRCTCTAREGPGLGSGDGRCNDAGLIQHAAANPPAQIDSQSPACSKA